MKSPTTDQLAPGTSSGAAHRGMEACHVSAWPRTGKLFAPARLAIRSASSKAKMLRSRSTAAHFHSTSGVTDWQCPRTSDASPGSVIVAVDRAVSNPRFGRSEAALAEGALKAVAPATSAAAPRSSRRFSTAASSFVGNGSSYLPIPWYVSPTASTAAGSYKLRRSTNTPDETSDRTRARSRARNSSHSVAITTASLPSIAA